MDSELVIGIGKSDKGTVMGSGFNLDDPFRTI
jgi:hypothetical protein